MIIQGIVMLILLMGNAVWPALALTLVILFINFGTGSAFIKINRQVMEVKDRRIKVVNECFTNVRFVKLGATENYFLTRMCELKVEELNLLKKIFSRVTWISFLNRLSPT